MTCLRIQSNPHYITALRNVTILYHTSLPTAGSVSISECRLSLVTCARSRLRVSLDLAADDITSFPSFNDTSTAESCSSPTSLANDLGMRNARLFPHFCIRVFIQTPPLSVSTKKIHQFLMFVKVNQPTTENAEIAENWGMFIGNETRIIRRCWVTLCR